MTSNQVQAQPEITVEIDLFSGRPNPRWTLGPQDVARIMPALPDESTPRAAGGGDEPLGFRGFVVTVATATERRRLHVHDGQISSETGDYRDIDRRLETALIGVLPADLKRQFGSLISPAP